MKQLEFQTLVPGCSIQDFHQIALSDDSAISKFHREVNKDESVKVSTWSTDDAAQTMQRLVEFILPMSIPKSVQSFIGAGPVRIKEQQTVSWLDDATIKIVSEPEVQVSYAKSLVTKAELMVQGSSSGVSIDVRVVVTASVPWPMQGTIESLMADQAKKTVGQYVEWIGSYVEGALEDINNMRRQQEDAAAQAATEAVAMLPQLSQQLEVQAVGPPTPPESTAAAAQPAAAAAVTVAAPPTPAPVTTAIVPRPAAAAAVAVAAPSAVTTTAATYAAADADVFFDASEVVPGGTLDLLLREMREAREARDTTNRLLLSIKESVQHVDLALARELAFQEGVRHAQLVGSSSGGSSAYSWLLSVAATAALASTATTFLLMRRNALH